MENRVRKGNETAMKLESVCGEIEPVSAEWRAKAFERLDALTKPRRSLGVVEELAARYVALREDERACIAGKRIVVFVGDHGVVAEGVSAYPREVTALMVRNFLGGGAAINVLGRRAGADVHVIDIGMKEDLGGPAGLICANVKRGTDNIAVGPAMSEAEAVAAIEVGCDVADRACADGVTMVATGEMGIGNTTPAAAIYAALLGLSARDVAGPGTGLSEDGVVRKALVIEKAIEANRAAGTEPLAVLAALGGLEIAGICGFCMGAARHRIGVVVDGYISSAGALVAMRLCPPVADYLFFSHVGAEPGHRRFFECEGIRPILDLDLRLGEGTGAAIAMQIIEDAVAIYNEMATFADIGITPGA